MTLPVWTDRPPSPRKRYLVVAYVWLAFAIVLIPVVGLLSVFALAPTQCPSTGGSLLCTRPSLQGQGFAACALLLLLSLALAGAAVAGRTGRAVGWRLAGSVGLFSLVVSAVSAGAASWS